MLFARFFKDRRASIAPMFALAAIPIVGFVGAAIDYSRANSVKAAMQAALDSTALYLSKSASTQTQSQMQQSATNYFLAVFNRPEAQNVSITPTYTQSGASTILVNGQATISTDFMKLMGFSQLTVTGSATVTWGNTKLRVALVLDNTGSMADDGKMAALQTATKNLLNQLKTAAASNGDVYVSIVPFVKDVNVDASNYKANWIDWTEWDASNGTCSSYSGFSAPTDQASCLSKGGKWKSANRKKTWNGCVVDRGNSNGPASQNYDTNVSAPNTSITASLYAAEQYSSCPDAAVMGLNYDWSTMTSLVNSMSPNGNTNQGIGLQLGWMSLVGGGPFSVPAMDPKYTYTQVIILMTDGLNTENRWYTNQNSIDARQAITCSNVKASGVTLYTIQVNTGGDATSTLLKNCASDSSKFFLLTSANQMISTFNQIGTALSNLRISK